MLPKKGKRKDLRFLQQYEQRPYCEKSAPSLTDKTRSQSEKDNLFRSVPVCSYLSLPLELENETSAPWSSKMSTMLK